MDKDRNDWTKKKGMKGNVMKRVEQWKKKRRQAEEMRKGTIGGGKIRCSRSKFSSDHSSVLAGALGCS